MQSIPLVNLFYLLIPIFIISYFYKIWGNDSFKIFNATSRMIIQLLLIGYALIYIFENKNIFLGFTILFFMIIVSSFITIYNLNNKTLNEFLLIFSTLIISGFMHIFLVIFVLKLENIYEPQYVIPISGMIFSNIINSLSLAIERYEKEYESSKDFFESRKTSFKASMIPQFNSLFAVGLVALPGMMTGQILSGIDPLIAVRYQIMIMAILFSSSGMSIIIYFILKSKGKL